MSVAMSPVISESCEYKENVAESPLAAGNPPRYPPVLDPEDLGEKKKNSGKIRNFQKYSGKIRNFQEFSGIFRKYQEKSGKIRKNQEFSGISNTWGTWG